MKTTRQALVKLFNDMGKDASKWKKARMLGAVKKLAEAGETDLESIEDKDLLDNILLAIEKDEDIEISDEKTTSSADESPKKPAKKAASKAAKPAKAAKKTAKKTDAADKPAKKGAEKDKFGARLGSQAATINSKIGKKGQTVTELAEATGLVAGRVRAHVAALIKNNHVKELDGGKVVQA